MCGIVGVAGKITKDARDAFEQMLFVCQLRGKHATGVVTVNGKNERDWYKVVGPAQNLLNSTKYMKMNTAWEKKIFLGHCRAATFGNPDEVSNAHPFEHDHIVGVHNGTLDHTWRWKLDNGREFDVDSNALMHNIAKNGAELTFGSVQGAWTAVWWDAKEKTINFLRNKERPLWIAHTEDNEIMLWASERWMLLVAERCGLKLKRDESGNWATPLPVDELWTISVNISAKKNEKIFSAKIKKVEGEAKGTYNSPFPVGGYRGGNRDTRNLPFRPQGQQAPPVVSLIKANPFEDDEVPEFMRPATETPPDSTKTVEESSNTNGSGTLSAPDTSPSTVSTDTKSSTPTSKPADSSPRKNLLTLPASNKKSTKESSTPTGSNVSQISTARNNRTIHRKIHGIGYVTDTNGDEFEETRLWKETGGKCCFCKQTVNSIAEVAEVYDRGTDLLCVSCVTSFDMDSYHRAGI